MLFRGAGPSSSPSGFCPVYMSQWRWRCSKNYLHLTRQLSDHWDNGTLESITPQESHIEGEEKAGWSLTPAREGTCLLQDFTGCWGLSRTPFRRDWSPDKDGSEKNVAIPWLGLLNYILYSTLTVDLRGHWISLSFFLMWPNWIIVPFLSLKLLCCWSTDQICLSLVCVGCQGPGFL